MNQHAPDADPRPARRRGRGPLAAAMLATLVVGAGGGAAASLLVGGHDTVTRVVSSPSTATTSTIADTSTATVNEIYSRTKKGVVDITATGSSGDGSSSGNGFGSPFGGQGQSQQTQTAEGTGFVVDKQGHIVTNEHVIDGATSIKVTFSDGTTTTAKLVGKDTSSDLAVLEVDVAASELSPLTFADSGKVQVGQSVIAIGNPYGLSETLTTGVISALGRSIDAPNDATIAGALQTDAAINPGNSGGPLLNADGQVIGVNAQIESSSNSNSGIGFAIPSSTVKRVAAELIAGKTVTHPYVGVELTDSGGGATVASVADGGPASGSGLRKGDVITAVDGAGVTSSDGVVAAVQQHQVGDVVTLTVKRSGATKTVEITLGQRPNTSS